VPSEGLAYAGRVRSDKSAHDRTESHVLPDPLRAEPRRVLVVWPEGQAMFDLPARGRVDVGRGLDCNLRVDHPSVSRRHFALECTPDGVLLEDLGSSNGTRVRGARPGPGDRTPLHPGDAVEFGASILVLQGKAQPAPGPTASTGQGPATVPPPAPASAEGGALGALIDLVARSNVDVILVGETGVGKEVAARALHEHSPRRDGPFVGLNCAAVTDALAESELFGHERGAFTGAMQAKAGLIEAAEGGTMFLDEVGELSPAVQAKLLRAVEAREVMRVGALRPRPVDVRFVAATNRDLEAAVRDGAFRQDLYYRLNGITISVPPLRERADSIPTLARTFVAQACEAARRPPLPLGEPVLAALRAHTWPGNVRELRKVMERAVLLCAGPEIGVEHLVLDKVGGPPAAEGASGGAAGLREELRGVQRKRVIDALERSGGHQRKAAELLGVSRRTLLNWLDALDLPRPRKEPRSR
jgi:two-component system response regulator AtoC